MSVAVVINGPAQNMTLYQNGALIGTVATQDTTLVRMDDVNNWLGRSQFVADEEFQGVLDEGAHLQLGAQRRSGRRVQRRRAQQLAGAVNGGRAAARGAQPRNG